MFPFFFIDATPILVNKILTQGARRKTQDDREGQKQISIGHDHMNDARDLKSKFSF